MFYSLLGRLTWWAARTFLRRRYGGLMLPKPLIAGGALAIALGVVLAARRRDGSSD